MTKHTYSWHEHVPGTFGVPADWHDLGCQILLTTGLLDAVDTFSLVEVAVVAQRVMDECVPISKTGLGGLGLIGNRQGFFVAVNGPAPPSGVGRVKGGEDKEGVQGKGNEKERSWWNVLRANL